MKAKMLEEFRERVATLVVNVKVHRQGVGNVTLGKFRVFLSCSPEC